ncbi:MAG: hypothetical protein LBM64_04535, partial [Deltaproteobacteria bacterium]|nr:hypothetical protein [Deltaproteobacteria bacterium]
EWSASPGNAFLLDRLAAELCMAALRRRLSGQAPGPGQGQEETRRACAPLPPATPGLLAALREAGLAAGGADGQAPALAPALTRRYAVLTYGRARGCEACALRAGCPKLCE